MEFKKKKKKLTLHELRKISVGAIFSKQQQDRYKQSSEDEFYTLPTALGKKSRRELKRDWDIVDADTAEEQLNWLLYEGFRCLAWTEERVWENMEVLCERRRSAKLLGEDEDIGVTAEEQLNWLMYEGFRCRIWTGERVWENMAFLFERLKNAQLLGEDEDIGVTADEKLNWLLYEGRAWTEARVSEDMAVLCERLRNAQLLGEDEDIKGVDLTAWDMGRLSFLARSCLEHGYISEAKAWEYIDKAYEKSAEQFNTWEELAKSYLIGRVVQMDSECEFLEYFLYVAKWLQKHPSSPWLRVSLK